jgi:hypothetical protein
MTITYDLESLGLCVNGIFHSIILSYFSKNINMNPYRNFCIIVHLLQLEIHLNRNENLVSPSLCILVSKIEMLMIFRVIIRVHSENGTKSKNNFIEK